MRKRLFAILATAVLAACLAVPAGAFASTTATTNASVNTLFYLTPATNADGTLQTQYIKFTAASSGYLGVETVNAEGTIKLLNYKKSSLSNTVTIVKNNDYSYVDFGVSKGKTYYIKYTPTTSANAQFRLVNRYVSDKSGYKKSKAKKLYKSSVLTGSIIAGSSRADWYKFYCSENTCEINVGGCTNNTLKIAIYHKCNGKTKVWYTYIKRSYDPNYSWIASKTLTTKMLKKYKGSAKGYWYVKVYRGTSTSSGAYAIARDKSLLSDM